MLVVDASVIAYFVMPDEGGFETDPLYQLLQESPTIAPAIYWYEIRNIALKGERRGRLNRARADQVMRAIDAFPMKRVELENADQITQLARRHALSFYDASYLTLALNERAQLATLAARLAAAARAEDVLLKA